MLLANEIFMRLQMCLTADKKEEMELICSLAVHSETVIKRLNKIFEDYVLQQGLDEIEKCANETIKVSI